MTNVYAFLCTLHYMISITQMVLLSTQPSSQIQKCTCSNISPELCICNAALCAMLSNLSQSELIDSTLPNLAHWTTSNNFSQSKQMKQHSLIKASLQ